MSDVVAIEALLPEVQGVPCESCGQSVYSLTRRFNAFLDEHVSASLRDEFRSSVYAIRSQLAHGLSLYEVDEPFSGVLESGFTDALKTRVAAQAGILNWLLARAPGPQSRAGP